MNSSVAHNWSDFFGMFAGCLCWVLLFVGVSWIVGFFVFRPLNESTLLFKVNYRFRISDLIILATHLQISVGVLLAALPGNSLPEKTAIACGVGLLITFWWFNGVRMLAVGGVEYTWHRWLFLGLLLPVGYLSGLAMIGAVILLVVAAGMLLHSLVDGDLQETFLALASVFPSMIFFGLIVACRNACRPIAERARDERAQRDGIQFGNVVSRPLPDCMRHRSHIPRSVAEDGVFWVREQW